MKLYTINEIKHFIQKRYCEKNCRSDGYIYCVDCVNKCHLLDYKRNYEYCINYKKCI